MNIEQRLDLFAVRAHQLSCTGLIATGAANSLQLKIAGKQTVEGFELTINFSPPDIDLFRSYLMILRQFLADGETIYFNFVVGEICRHFPKSNLEACALRIKQDFNRLLREPIFPFLINNVPVGAKKVMEVFLNAEFFHNDIEKIEAIKQVKDTPQEPILRYIFFTTAVNLYAPIQNMGIVAHRRDDKTFLANFLAQLNAPLSS